MQLFGLSGWIHDGYLIMVGREPGFLVGEVGSHSGSSLMHLSRDVHHDWLPTLILSAHDPDDFVSLAGGDGGGASKVIS